MLEARSDPPRRFSRLGDRRAERICQNGPLAEEIGTKVGNSEDSRSGEVQRAFTEKRKAVWKGR